MEEESPSVSFSRCASSHILSVLVVFGEKYIFHTPAGQTVRQKRRVYLSPRHALSHEEVHVAHEFARRETN